jgi:hypothetical protein
MNVEERLKKLERSNLRFRLTIAGLFLSLLVVFTLAAIPAGGAKTYSIHDSAGARRAELSVAGGGNESPGLTFFGKNGEKRLFVGIDGKDNPVIRFHDGSGRPELTLNAGGQWKQSGSAAGGRGRTVCYSRDGRGTVFHRCLKAGEARCDDLEKGFPFMLSVDDALRKGLKPCPKCLPELSEKETDPAPRR